MDELYANKEYVNSVELHYKIQNFIKFSVVCIFGFSILFISHGIGLSQVIPRMLIGLVLVTIVWTIALIPLLYKQEQSFNDDWRKIQRSLHHEATELLKEPITAEEKKMLECKLNEVRWWKIRFFDNGIIDWVKRNLVEKSM